MSILARLVALVGVLTLGTGGVDITLETGKVINQVLPQFLSANIDASELTNTYFWDMDGKYPFNNTVLIRLAKELAPAFLRCGGTKADDLVYFHSNPSNSTILEKSTVIELLNYTRNIGFELFFGINAGPSARDSSGAWDPSNAIELLDFLAGSIYSDTVAGFELGNEPNLFLFNFGEFVTGEQLGKDFRNFRMVLSSKFQKQEWKLIGPDMAYQLPFVGDLFPYMMENFLNSVGDALEIITWHWYTLQSERCPAWWIDPYFATMERMKEIKTLDRSHYWAESVHAAVENYGTRKYKVWMGETAGVSCGGEPGVSDAFVNLFWWIDELGDFAQRGMEVVMRQDILGSDYGLLFWNSQNNVITPAPDYWAALLWKRLMGEKVLGVGLPAHNQKTRAYAHCTSSRHKLGDRVAVGSVTAVFINLEEQHPEIFVINGGNADAFKDRIEYHLTAPSGNLSSKNVLLNGKLLALENGHVPALPGTSVHGASSSVTVAPLSIAFVVFPSSAVTACL